MNKVLRYFLLFLFMSTLLEAYTLKQNYETKSREIRASDIIKNIKNDFVLYRYDDNEHSLRVSAQSVVEHFKEQGIDIEAENVRYVNFQERSLVDLSGIKKQLKSAFLDKYPSMQIRSLEIYPRSYLTTLPDEFSLSLRNRTLLNSYSTFAIVTPEHKMLFFDYILDADIKVVMSTRDIKRHEALNAQNTQEKRITFTKFQEQPLVSLQHHQYQSKFTIQSDSILTVNDVEALSLVRRGETVVVFIEDGGVSVSFEAKALQDGKEGDVISIKRDDGKKLNARVIGKRRVEIQ